MENLESNLEHILEEEYLENEIGHDRIVDSYGLEIQDHYMEDPDRLEILEAIDQIHNPHPKDPASFNQPEIVTLESDIEIVRELPPWDTKILRYLNEKRGNNNGS